MIELLETFLILDSSGRKTDLLYTVQKLSACMYLHFRTSTLSQSEIFSVRDVIAACSYGVSF